MSEGSDDTKAGATERPAGAAVEARGQAGGWVPLPPDPHATPGTDQPRRYRAPWASQVSPRRTEVPAQAATESRPATVPASAPGPEAPAEPEAGPRPATGRSGPQALTFGGSGSEYFRIWIVNVCLTVLTLGIYSAWAKVRNKRYFYRHTELDGSPFDYLAEPMQILKGRAILLGLVGLYVVASFISPVLEGLSWIVILFMVPWIVVRALRFRAATSAWRNIRFGFDASYGEAFKVFIGLPLLNVLTLGLAYPYAQWAKQRFITGNSRFGSDGFSLETKPGAFYRLYLKVGAMGLGLVVLAGAGSAMLVPAMVPRAFGSGIPVTGLVLMNVVVALASLGLWAYARAHTTNLVWNGTTVGPHRFESHLTARELLAIYVTNAIAVALSLGLLVPWARVRMARYRIEHLTVVPGEDLAAFAAGPSRGGGAIGEELGDALDLDLAL